jgi:membrane-bound lytic murein transglycosylase B
VARRSIPPAVALLTVLAVAVAVVLGLEQAAHEPAPPVAAPTAAPTPPSSGGAVDRDWVQSASRATSIPPRALTAYASAAVRLSREDEGCRIAWNTLAGIGASESSHGAFGGASVDDEGVATPRIIGVPLDGDGVMAIRDTDNGVLDGDTTWDRAVGPLQFIPRTWERWGADGDGDGRKDPHDMDDAALAAGRYLCSAGGDLGGSRGWADAVLTYNRSVAYATKVARTATTYAEAL